MANNPHMRTTMKTPPQARPKAGPRVGFLFNHDQIHQIAHSLPIAMAMARDGFEGHIIIATTNDRLATEVRRLAGDMLSGPIEHRLLLLSPVSARLTKWLGSVIPASKLLIYRDNLDFFRGLDLLVVAEKTSLLLKSRYGLTDLFMVHTRHGAGDRAIGFDKASAGFDHILCSGPKIKDRLISETRVNPQQISIVGYPKFDLVSRREPFPEPEAKRRCTVLYNPHPSPHLSSWYRDGRAILDFFADHDVYELIFAPHIMLFERKFVISVDRFRIDRPGQIADHILRADNIHIDTGSRASTDMSYTLAADIYIGDASSQVYEFLVRPRPCIFVNTHGVQWRDHPDFRHWTCGEVISGPAELPAALARAESLHQSHFRAVQEVLFAESFDLSETASSQRAARVISMLAHQNIRSVDTPAPE